LGFSIVAPDSYASPGVITIALPETISSERLGRQLEEAGYFLSYKSKYLLKRNWIQICLMGECSKEKMVPLMDLLKQFCHRGLSPSQSMAPSLLNVGERAPRHD
jgi:aspartate aminotransferase-like enzyme